MLNFQPLKRARTATGFEGNTACILSYPYDIFLDPMKNHHVRDLNPMKFHVEPMSVTIEFHQIPINSAVNPITWLYY